VENTRVQRAYVDLLPAVSGNHNPALGINYAEHGREAGMTEPFLFPKMVATSATLKQNAAQLTWLFNMQQSRPNPSGFANNNYGAAVVLAGSAADLTTGNGYAVVYGNASQPDSLRLMRYTGGLPEHGPLVKPK
jgi:hypothetical protein